MYVQYWEKIMQGKRKDQVRFSYQMVAFGMFMCSALILALLITKLAPKNVPEVEATTNEYWIPTEQDIIEIDSLYNQVKDIEEDVEQLNESVDRIDRKLDDMIEEQSDEEVMWIGENGDTIWD